MIIATYASTGQICFFDGFGFSFLRSNAKVMDSSDAIKNRNNICNEFPACWIEAA